MLDIIEGLMDVVPDFKYLIEVPRSSRTYHQVLDWMKKLIDQDEEKLQRLHRKRPLLVSQALLRRRG